MAGAGIHTSMDNRQSVRSRSLLLRILGICLISAAGVWLLLCACLQIALNSVRVKERMLEAASGFVDGRISLESLEGQAFRHFPDIGISLKNLAVTGPGEHGDTLASLDGLELRLRTAALLKGGIQFPYIRIDGLRADAVLHEDGSASWDILLMPESDSSSSLPHVILNSVTLEGNSRLRFASEADGTEITACISGIDFRGRLDIADPFGHKGRIALGADALLELHDPRTGAADLPVRIGIDAKSPARASKTLVLDHLDLDLGVLAMNGRGSMVFDGDSCMVKAEVSANARSVQEAVRKYACLCAPELEGLETDACTEMFLMAEGWLNPSGKLFPCVLAEIRVPDCSLSYGRFRNGSFCTEIEAESDVHGNISLALNKFLTRLDGLELNISGSAEDILCEDPLIGIDLESVIELDKLSDMLPEGMSAKGNLLAALKGYILLSDCDLYNFGKGDLDGIIMSDAIEFRDDPDSIYVFLDRTDITLSREESGDMPGIRLLGFTGTVDTLNASVGQSAYIKGKDLAFSIHNTTASVETVYGKEHHPLLGRISAGGLDMVGTDSLHLTVRDSRNSFRYSNLNDKGDEERPVFVLSSSNANVTMIQDVNRAGINNLSLTASAAKREIRSGRNGRRARRDSVKAGRNAYAEDGFVKDLEFSFSESLSSFFRKWTFNGSIDMDDGILLTPYFPLENKVENVSGRVSDREIRLDNLTLRSGGSDLSMKGSISGIRRAMNGRGVIDLNLDVTSEQIKADELMAAYSSGSHFAESGSGKDFGSGLSEEQYLDELKSESIGPGETELLVIPGNVNAKIRLEGNDIDYSNLCIDWFESVIAMKDRTLQITNTVATSNLGDIYFEGFYSTRSKNDISAGFDLNMASITADKVLALFPAVDTLMPMLKSFKGQLDCEMAATSQLDTAMNFILPSVSGILSIKGSDLSLEGDEGLDKLAKVLMFKDRKMGKIADMSVQGVIKDNLLEVFPFVMEVDRYVLAMNGIQNFDQSFKYHISVLRSPVPFRFGINLSGNFDDWKYKIGKAKYKNVNVPVFSQELKDMQTNLVRSIHDIFTRGVVSAVAQNEEAVGGIDAAKESAGYDSSADTDSMDEAEMEEFNRYIDENQHSGVHGGDAETSDVVGGDGGDNRG